MRDPDRRRPETVFLDVGGVLANPNWERVRAALERHGIVVSAQALAAAEPHAKRIIDDAEHVGRSDDDSRGVDLFHLVLDRLGVERGDATTRALAEIRDYHARHNLWESVPEGVPRALERLRGLVDRLVVVSNANGILHAHLERLDLVQFFDHVLDSRVEGVEKPDPRIFERALERAGASASTTLHVGDLFQIDVVGARAAGLRAALVDVAGLYPDADCPRFASFPDFVESFAAGEPF